MKVLVLGRHGQVARALQQRLPQALYFGRAQLDLEQIGNIQATIRDAQPDFIVNAAAYTAVDAAESEQEQPRAWRINAEAVGEIAAAAADLRAPLLHISTDYVFAGDATRPYREADPVAPVNAYGASKLQGERELTSRPGDRWWILRTSAVFSEFGHNFVKTMLRLAGERDQLSIVDDQRTRPSYAGHIADAIVRMVERDGRGQPVPSGIYHCTSSGEATWFALAKTAIELGRELGLIAKMPELKAITTAEYPTAAARPRHSVLDTEKLTQELGWGAPHWREGLESALQSMRKDV
jgi:dTDP-4-dehydrorhamnose reductase